MADVDGPEGADPGLHRDRAPAASRDEPTVDELIGQAAKAGRASVELPGITAGRAAQLRIAGYRVEPGSEAGLTKVSWD